MPETVNIAKGIADMKIGDRIRNRRLALNMTQEELAKKLGYKTKGSISKIESNERELPTQKIKRFAEILDTSPAYLMGWEDMTQTTNTGNHNTTTNITNNYDACSDCSIMNGKSNYEYAINAMMRLDNEEVQSLISFAESLIKARTARR
jgi:transcriptional regulator, XRE family|nr:MAG TPA: helix-turn-helix domain protein [Caudoviricetes sp.]